MDKGKSKAADGNGKRGRLEENNGGGKGKNARPKTAAQDHKCPRMQLCRDFLKSLNLNPVYFDTQHDRCLCEICAAADGIPDVLEQTFEHGQPYEVPRGWCGFGLAVPARAHAAEVFTKWAVSFHGCPSTKLTSILEEGQLMKPGDMLLNNTQLPNRLTVGEDRIGLYTSPSIKYSELDIYTDPTKWKGHSVRVVLQCRQKMDIRWPELKIERETVGWKQRFGSVAISQHFTNEEIERCTTVRNSIVPYKLLIAMDLTTRKQEEEDKEELQQQVEAAANNAKEARKAYEEAENAKKASDAAEKKSKAAQAEHSTAAAAQKAAEDKLVQRLCAVVTDQDNLCKLQPVIQGLVHHRRTEVKFRDWKIDWTTAAGLEAAAAVAAAMAYSSSLTSADLQRETIYIHIYIYTYIHIHIYVLMYIHMVMNTYTCIYIHTYIYTYVIFLQFYKYVYKHIHLYIYIY